MNVEITLLASRHNSPGFLTRDPRDPEYAFIYCIVLPISDPILNIHKSATTVGGPCSQGGNSKILLSSSSYCVHHSLYSRTFSCWRGDDT
ncbi:hypothetical protein IV203_010357 [Nitzschia inconspicua]|uniref:Uncharacterized protein n=1 Tax=Nitzschia inconspicua TaxID=303405 RepID=A0A9K3PKE2_9STRA|nr:hypothetical protein IV203_010357 [Nitzschia inconspicua]